MYLHSQSAYPAKERSVRDATMLRRSRFSGDQELDVEKPRREGSARFGRRAAGTPKTPDSSRNTGTASSGKHAALMFTPQSGYILAVIECS